jgi:hypothetical protein
MPFEERRVPRATRVIRVRRVCPVSRVLLGLRARFRVLLVLLVQWERPVRFRVLLVRGVPRVRLVPRVLRVWQVRQRRREIEARRVIRATRVMAVLGD